MRYTWLLLAIFLEDVTSYIVIKKINFKFNPNFGKATAVLETLPSGTTTMNVDANLTKPLNGKATLTTSFYYMNGKTKIPVMRIPTINYCDMMRGHFMPMQLVQKFIDQIQEFGRLVVPCPIQPGHYYLKNFYIDETQLPMFQLLQENYMIVLEVIFGQEVLSKRASVFEIQGYFTCNKSNWP